MLKKLYVIYAGHHAIFHYLKKYCFNFYTRVDVCGAHGQASVAALSERLIVSGFFTFYP